MADSRVYYDLMHGKTKVGEIVFLPKVSDGYRVYVKLDHVLGRMYLKYSYKMDGMIEEFTEIVKRPHYFADFRCLSDLSDIEYCIEFKDHRVILKDIKTGKEIFATAFSELVKRGRQEVTTSTEFLNEGTK